MIAIQPLKASTVVSRLAAGGPAAVSCFHNEFIWSPVKDLYILRPL